MIHKIAEAMEITVLLMLAATNGVLLGVLFRGLAQRYL